MPDTLKVVDVLDRLPGELAARLASDPYFADVPVILADKGNVRAEFERLQAVITDKGGKRGVAVIVLQIVADDELPEVAFGPMILRPAFHVVENVELNRDSKGTGKSARKVARAIVKVIKPMRLAGLVTELVVDKPGIEPVNLGELKSVIAYQVNFLCYEADTEEMSQVEMPAFAAVSDSHIAITCGTVGARIFYTIDDTYPAPPDCIPTSTAVEYGSPIEVPFTGFMLRACGYPPIGGTAVASQVNRAWIEPE